LTQRPGKKPKNFFFGHRSRRINSDQAENQGFIGLIRLFRIYPWLSVQKLFLDLYGGRRVTGAGREYCIQYTDFNLTDGLEAAKTIFGKKPQTLFVRGLQLVS